MSLFRFLRFSTLFAYSFAFTIWKAPVADKLDWWQDSVIYQIYPKSFKDSDGDGIGDIRGIIQSLDYIKDLGVEAVWISPLYESPMIDSGYDVSNFTKIDPKFGTLKDFKELVEEMKKMNIKLIMDFVPNHSSDQHEWFKKSSNNESEYRDYYVWADPKIVGNQLGPPNNWLSVFSGSAWTYSDARKQYYLHQFSPNQPDFNLRNKNVVEKLWGIMEFWLKLGVNGFRMGSVNHMFEAPDLPDEEVNLATEITNSSKYDYLKHTYTKDQPEVFELLADFRRRLDNYSASTDNVPRVMITEAYTGITETMKYYGNSSEKISHFPFNFNLVENLEREAELFFGAIGSWISSLPSGAWPNWVMGNHDKSRVATRYGPHLADALNMISLLLPGTSVTYYGEEIAMENTDMMFSETKDIMGKMAGINGYKEASRDFQRTPFQWNSKDFAGFTNGSSTWLPVNPDYVNVNVQDQKLTNSSHLSIYRELVKLRKLPAVQKGDTYMEVIGSRVLAFKRIHSGDDQGVVVVVNFGEDQLEYINLAGALNLFDVKLKVVIASNHTTYKSGEEVGADYVWLEPNEGVVFTYQQGGSSASISSISFMLIASLLSAVYLFQ